MLRFLIYLVFAVMPLAAAWQSEAVNAPYGFFNEINEQDRKNVIDSQDRMHVVYGGDGLFHTWFDGTSWQTEMIDTTHDVGEYASVAIDGEDHLYVIYKNETGDLIYAHNRTGTWTKEKLSLPPNAFSNGNVPSMAIDRQKKVHIIYALTTYISGSYVTNIQHLTNSSGDWSVETAVENAGLSVFRIVVDGNDIAHIVYLDSSHVLHHASRNASGWSSQAIKSDVSISTSRNNLSLDIDSDDHIHLVYSQDFNLTYMTDKLGSWSSINLSQNGARGEYVSLAVDSQDAVHISAKGSADNILYINNTTGTWSDQLVPQSHNLFFTSIAVDSNQKAHIVYCNGLGGTFKLDYATNAVSGWSVLTLDTSDSIREYPSLALGKSGHVFVSNFSFAGNKIEMASNISGAYSVEEIEGGGFFSSIGVDSNEKVHISYYDANKQLRYATNTLGSWSYVTLDSDIDSGEFNALTVDKNDKVHICYYDNNTSEFKYITNASGSGWVETVVMTNAYVSYRPDIAVDSNGAVHLVFLDGDKLYYADNSSGSFSVTQLQCSEGHCSFEGQAGIAIDGKDKVHIVTKDRYGEKIAYTTNTLGAWTMVEINVRDYYSGENLTKKGHYIAADKDGHVYITMGGYGKSFYFTNRSGSWETERLWGTEEAPIRLDRQGDVHIAYEKNGNIYHAVKKLNKTVILVPIINYLLN